MGELYNYRVVNSDIVFGQLYGILSYGEGSTRFSAASIGICRAVLGP